ncbi:MAG: hypothetical protein GY845_28785 [Planctomycetes bacterium]|nr:hypothetical protein [Planctomycetota bacterium]
MNISKIINHKSVAVIAGFIAGIYIIDSFDSGWNKISMLICIGWLFAGALTWTKQFWGVVLLLLLALHNEIFYTFFDILNFKNTIDSISSETDFLSNSIIQDFAIISILFETVIFLCIMYYAITVIIRKKVY